jgi:hypothetical protein
MVIIAYLCETNKFHTENTRLFLRVLYCSVRSVRKTICSVVFLCEIFYNTEQAFLLQENYLCRSIFNPELKITFEN